MDVPRPSSRVEIVAAMRRVRYEFKAKGVKKRKVTIEVSTDGVRVSTRKKKAKTKKGAKFFSRGSSSDSSIENIDIMHHPIYRIFYVSHDSSDLKIFSYIARDGATNLFKCNVFKSNRKSQAMRIVRTVGQAFEVCHKMQINTPEQAAASTSSAADDLAFSDRASDQPPPKEAVSDCGASEASAASTSKVVVESAPEEKARPIHLELLPPPPRKSDRRTPQRTMPPPTINLPELPECVTQTDVVKGEDVDVATPLSSQHQLQLLQERLEQQAQQTRAAVAQLFLLRDQLAAEQAARCEAQARTHQLLVHNKELLEHIAALVAHLQERERGHAKPINAQQLTLLPQFSTLAPIIKKPGTGSTGKGGLGSFGKSGLSSTGKSGISSSGKSGISSSGKSGISSSGKSGGLLGSLGKSGLSSTSKSGLSYTSKSPTSKSGSSLLSKSASPKPSKSFDIVPTWKPTSITPSSPTNFPSSSSNLAYGNPKTAKSSATFGIIWIPNRKRSKKKDIVLNSNNDTHRIRERSPSFYKFMSGDSHDQPHKKEEADLLVVSERKIPSGPLAAATALATTAATDDAPSANTAATSLDDKQQLIRQDTENSREASGDSKDDANSDDDQDFLHNDGPVRKNLPDTLSEKDMFRDRDNPDSVYLRPPPPHKARSNVSRTEEEESCGMKCLYYTLQCCDCVLM